METKTPRQIADEIAENLADILRDVFQDMSHRAFIAGYKAAEERMGKLISDHDNRWQAEAKADD